ncbi:hypothetical protein J6590_013130 [Homalodisca vitripennis]|nr:hypothetical protein J6590_013130 [Homalodisca vitripennis]
MAPWSESESSADVTIPRPYLPVPERDLRNARQISREAKKVSGGSGVKGYNLGARQVVSGQREHCRLGLHLSNTSPEQWASSIAL